MHREAHRKPNAQHQNYGRQRRQIYSHQGHNGQQLQQRGHSIEHNQNGGPHRQQQNRNEHQCCQIRQTDNDSERWSQIHILFPKNERNSRRVIGQTTEFVFLAHGSDGSDKSFDFVGIDQAVKVEGQLGVDERKTFGDFKFVVAGWVEPLFRFGTEFALVG